MQKLERFAALDLARFIAALIVFSGHMVFLPEKFNWTQRNPQLLSPIRTGATAVMFFFALSGFVLTVRSSSTRYLDWTLRRIFRLYPVYISAWMAGLLLVILHNLHLLNLKIVLLGILGFQTLSPEATLVVNAPLWSLSIEIVFALFLYYLIKLREKPLYLFIILVVTFTVSFKDACWPILDTLPFFIIGIFLRNERICQLRMSRKFKGLILFAGILWYFSIGANEISKYSNSLGANLFRLFGIGFFLLVVSQVRLNSRFNKIAVVLGKRSFCLYAFHYPILLFFDYFLDPATGIQFFIYSALSIGFTALLTEVSFRLIDQPAIARAKRDYR